MFEMAGIVCLVVCFGTVDTPNVGTSDFCQRYERQVITKEDAEAVKKLPRRIRDRIQGNELDYLCQCLKWTNKACDST